MSSGRACHHELAPSKAAPPAHVLLVQVPCTSSLEAPFILRPGQSTRPWARGHLGMVAARALVKRNGGD